MLSQTNFFSSKALDLSALYHNISQRSIFSSDFVTGFEELTLYLAGLCVCPVVYFQQAFDEQALPGLSFHSCSYLLRGVLNHRWVLAWLVSVH